MMIFKNSRAEINSKDHGNFPDAIIYDGAGLGFIRGRQLWNFRTNGMACMIFFYKKIVFQPW